MAAKGRHVTQTAYTAAADRKVQLILLASISVDTEWIM